MTTSNEEDRYLPELQVSSKCIQKFLNYPAHRQTNSPKHKHTKNTIIQRRRYRSIYTVRRTFSFHSHCQTFLIAAVLAAITLALVYNAVLFITTSILQLLAHCALEKAFAAFAAATRQAIQHYSAELQYSAVEAKPTVFS